MYSSKEFWLYSTFLQIVASETLALGASDKNLSTVLNTQVKPKKKQDESKNSFAQIFKGN